MSTIIGIKITFTYGHSSVVYVRGDDTLYSLAKWVSEFLIGLASSEDSIKFFGRHNLSEKMCEVGVTDKSEIFVTVYPMGLVFYYKNFS